MYRCPTCNRTYDEQAPGFCPEDGTPLSIGTSVDRQTSHRSTVTEEIQGLGGKATWSATQNQIPELQQYLDQQKKPSATPWALIIGAIILVIIAIVIAVFVLRGS